MFTSPLRLSLTFRRGLRPGLLLSGASVSAMFAASPLLIPALADDLDVSVSAAGVLSSLQVATFALVSFFGGRLLRSSRRLLRTSLIVLALSNVASALVPTFTLLLLTRLVAGLAAGIVNWIAWGHAARHPRSMGAIAAIGPTTAAVASLAYGLAMSQFGYPAVYVLLAVLSLAAFVTPMIVEATEPIGKAVSPSRSNRILLIALGGLTLFGSSLFIYVGVLLGPAQGAPQWLVAAALAGNALAGIIGARTSNRHSAVWFGAVAAAALMLGVSGNVWVAATGAVIWGGFFWLAIPSVLRLLEDFSDQAGERTGDAQAVMAAGRVLGPLLGGVLLGAFGTVTLGYVAGVGLLVVAVVVSGVERYRRHVVT